MESVVTHRRSVKATPREDLTMLAAEWFPEWVPGVLVAVIGSVLSAWLAMARAQTRLDARLDLLKAEQDHHDADEREVKSDLKDAIRELKTIASDVKVITAEQAVINRVTNLALEGIADKLDIHSKLLNEHAQQLSLMRELLTGPCRPGKPCWKEPNEGTR